MARIEANNEHIVLMNIIAVEPGRADALIQLLEDATESVMRHRQGFISASLHRSLDGTRVANYAQWRTKADFDAMLADPACQEHMKAAADMAEGFEPVLYTVASVHGG